MTTTTDTLTVNGHPADAGCYVDGWWGQYGPDHLADQLEMFDIDIPAAMDPRRLRRWADHLDSLAGEQVDYRAPATTGQRMARAALTLWEGHSESADQLIELANDATAGGFWEWRDGEVFLSSFVCSQCGRDCREDDEADPCDYCADCWD